MSTGDAEQPRQLPRARVVRAVTARVEYLQTRGELIFDSTEMRISRALDLDDQMGHKLFSEHGKPFVLGSLDRRS